MNDTASLALRRTTEMAAMFMIGDGVLGLLRAEPHLALWRSDIGAVDGLTRPFQDHSGRRRLYGLAQILAGLTLAAHVTRQN